MVGSVPNYGRFANRTRRRVLPNQLGPLRGELSGRYKVTLSTLSIDCSYRLVGTLRTDSIVSTVSRAKWLRVWSTVSFHSGEP